MRHLIAAAIAVAALGAIAATPADAQTRVTLKSATAGSSYYLMMVQLGEALKTASNGELSPTVEESQGSVQNVKEAARRQGNFVFTTPPGLVRDARDGKAPFAGESGYDAVRGLFPIPGITMHWVVRADAGVQSLADRGGARSTRTRGQGQAGRHRARLGAGRRAQQAGRGVRHRLDASLAAGAGARGDDGDPAHRIERRRAGQGARDRRHLGAGDDQHGPMLPDAEPASRDGPVNAPSPGNAGVTRGP